jgi:hypothetical protein
MYQLEKENTTTQLKPKEFPAQKKKKKLKPKELYSRSCWAQEVPRNKFGLMLLI